MNRYPTVGDIIELPNKRGELLVVDVNAPVSMAAEYRIRYVPASRMDKITGWVNDAVGKWVTVTHDASVAPSAKVTPLQPIRLIGTAKIEKHVQYRIVKRLGDA